VTLNARPLWQLRVVRETSRYIWYAACVAGIAASLRFALAPPRPLSRPASVAPSARVDRAAEGYAVLFARRYLSWGGGEASAGAHGLEEMLGGNSEPGGWVVPPASGEEQISWAEVVQVREPAPARRVYTVAAETDGGVLIYLAVEIARTAGGSLAIAGYPALVGPPASAPELALPGAGEVRDAQLSSVVDRGLRNYLAAAPDELAADLAPGARVSLPPTSLRLDSVQSLRWATTGGSVLAIVVAVDRRGAQYTLEYELAVVRAQGRWEIAAVQTDPDH
jgi:hypothetical protein